MTDVFDYAVNVIFEEEKGYVDDPNDPGGATNLGITLKTLSTWRGRAVSKDDVRALTKEEAAKIYKSLYWDKVRGDDLRPAVALLLFDAAVNHGVGDSIRLAQRALNLGEDGIMGPQTFRALNITDTHQFISYFQAENALFYISCNGFGRYGRGWLRRAFSCTVDASNFILPN